MLIWKFKPVDARQSFVKFHDAVKFCFLTACDCLPTSGIAIGAISNGKSSLIGSLPKFIVH